jgi:hypothetical protein
MQVAMDDECQWSTTRPAYIRSGCLWARAAAASPAAFVRVPAPALLLYACARAIIRQVLARSLVIKHARASWRRRQDEEEIEADYCQALRTN